MALRQNQPNDYDAGNWSLPQWWTDYPPVRSGKLTHAEQIVFYSSDFVRNVIGHEGGITTLPVTESV